MEEGGKIPGIILSECNADRYQIAVPLYQPNLPKICWNSQIMKSRKLAPKAIQKRPLLVYSRLIFLTLATGGTVELPNKKPKPKKEKNEGTPIQNLNTNSQIQKMPCINI
jgi:hypothetical protein